MKRSNKILSCIFIFTLMFIMPHFVLANNIINDDIEHNKYLTSNNDGTYKLLLDVTGKTSNTSHISKANVIIILDTSGSMDDTVTNYNKEDNITQNRTYYGLKDGEYKRLSYWNSQECYRFSNSENECYTGDMYIKTNSTRLAEAQKAVNNLAEELLKINTPTNTDTIELALITFAKNVKTQNFGSTNSPLYKTTSYTAFSNKVDNLSADGGTNWEAALKAANDIEFNDSDPTYVIFVSDGNPTYYIGGGNGQEGSTNVSTSYEHAKDDAKALVDNGYKLYTIGVYGDVNRMQELNIYSNGSGYYAASDTDELVAAFNEILEEITTSGIGNVIITDGTTAEIAAKHGGLLSVKSDSMRYYLSVKLNEDNKYISSSGVEYTFSFDNNNTVTISWGENNTATYSGKIVDKIAELDWDTATDFYDAPVPATYTDYTINWGVTSNALLLNDVTYTVSIDVWPSQYTLDLVANLENNPSMTNPYPQYLIRETDGYYLKTNTTAKVTYTNSSVSATDTYESSYQMPEPISTKSADITINKHWVNTLDDTNPETIEIGLKRDNEQTSTPITITAGTNWSISRFISPGLISLSYDESDNPISAIIRETGHDYTFIENDYHWDLTADIIHPMVINDEVKILILTNDNVVFPNNSIVLKQNNNIYYKIGNSIYKEGNSNNTITITNSRRSNLNLTKQVIGDADPNEIYNFRIIIDTGNNQEEIWYSICQDLTATNPTYNYLSILSGTPLDVELKNNWNLRFINLPLNTRYTIIEILNDDNFVLDSINKSDVTNGTITLATKTISGSISESNKSYVITYVNRYLLTNITVTKEWSSTTSTTIPNNVTVGLYYSDDDSSQTFKYGDDITLDKNNWTYTWENLLKYIKDGTNYITRNYFVSEIKVNDVLLDNNIYYVKDNTNAIVGKWVSSQTSEDIATGINYIITNTYNDMPFINLNFKKVSFDDSETGLSGALFRLYRYIKDNYSSSSNILDNDWALIGDASSNESGLVEFTENLYNGIYRLVEVEAPDGYILPGGNWIIQVSNNQNESNLMINFISTTDDSTTPSVSGGNDTIYKIANQRIPLIPTTGGRGIVGYNILGLVIMFIGTLSLIFNKKKGLSTDNQ